MQQRAMQQVQQLQLQPSHRQPPPALLPRPLTSTFRPVMPFWVKVLPSSMRFTRGQLLAAGMGGLGLGLRDASSLPAAQQQQC